MIEETERPNPDELLARIQSEAQASSRGRLKIFLGYAAGVGKTYAMLEAAHQRLSEGIDLVVGVVETHKRPETETMLAGLEVIPLRSIQYHGVELKEMDVDAILARRPRLVLVDELAHTNAPGSRQLKRYQDVEELLDAGIDVYTTLNIQHIESLNDVVAQITGVKVRETVPDKIIDHVFDIELIDLPPDELLVRLNEGKVYVPEQAARAIQMFFRKGNLTALREIALRRTAERVDDQMRSYMQVKSIPGPWAAAERLLVCISPSPLAERLVRSARRLAGELNAEWEVVFVEPPSYSRMTQSKRDQIARTLRLAEELGAKTVTLPGHSVVDTVLDYARKQNITKLIVGKPVRPRLDELIRGSVVDRLARQSGRIDVYIISGEPGPLPPPAEFPWRPHTPYMRYVWAVLIVLSATLLGRLFHLRISPTNLVMIYLLSVVVAATYLGRGPAILVSFLSVLVFDFFFIPPYMTFAVSDTEYLLTFLGLLIVGVVISQLTSRVRHEAEAAARREADTSALYSLSRDLAAVSGMDQILKVVVDQVSRIFDRDAAIFLPDAEAPTLPRLATHSDSFNPDQNETAVAVWVFQHGQAAGRGTDTLSAAEARYLPLKTAQGVVGVLGVRPRNPAVYLPPDERRLLDAFANQAAIAIERAQLAEQARRAQLFQDTEKLQTALLNSISHDLRTPLVSITGVLTTIGDSDQNLDTASLHNLVEIAREEAERLNRLVGNLLHMTRIEAGALRLNLQPSDIDEVIGAALESVRERVKSHPLSVKVQDDLPAVSLDFILIVQVLVNLLDNAIKYSYPGQPIEVAARLAGSNLEIEIRDHGIGIPPAELPHIFDKFYRIQRPDQVSGTGLGLSICKGIIEAHSGYIHAENHPDGGAVFTIAIPLTS